MPLYGKKIRLVSTQNTYLSIQGIGAYTGSCKSTNTKTPVVQMNCVNNIDKVYREADLAFKLIEENELSSELYGVATIGKMIKHVSDSQDSCPSLNLDW